MLSKNREPGQVIETSAVYLYEYLHSEKSLYMNDS